MMKIPTPSTSFDGKGKPEDVEAWLFGYDHYFKLAGTDDNKKVAFAALKLKDNAILWFRTETLRKKMPDDWNAFCDVFRSRWLPTNNAALRRRAWQNCRQHGLVAQYTQTFLSLMDGAGFIHETEAVNRYIEGLRPKVAAHLLHEQPTTLDDAIHKAEHFDGSYGEASPFRSPRSGSSVSAGLRSLVGATSSLADSSLPAVGSLSGPTPMEVDSTQHFRHKRDGQASGLSSKVVMEEGRCYRCYEKGHQGKNCPTFGDHTAKGKEYLRRRNNGNGGNGSGGRSFFSKGKGRKN